MEKTLQEVFDQGALHLLTQGKKAQDSSKAFAPCLYRGPDGTKCGVGGVIPNELYDPAIESAACCSEVVEFEVNNSSGHPRRALRAVLTKAGLFTPEMLPLLQGLQEAHDQCEVRYWPGRLHSLARRFHLNPGVICQWEKERAATPRYVHGE